MLIIDAIAELEKRDRQLRVDYDMVEGKDYHVVNSIQTPWYVTAIAIGAVVLFVSAFAYFTYWCFG